MSRRRKGDWIESDNPDDWPEPFRRIRQSASENADGLDLDDVWQKAKLAADKNPEIDAETEALYQTHMRYVRRQQFRRVMPYLAAAAAVAVCVGAFFLVQSRSVTPATIAKAQGVGTLSREGTSQALAPGLALASGDVVEVSRGARIWIQAGEGLSLSIAGPASVRLERAQAGGAPDHDWRISSGVVYVRGEPGKPRRVVWRTASGAYTLAGTVARLVVQESRERLDVAEGAISFSTPDGGAEPVTIAAGQTALLAPVTDGGPRLQLRPLAAPEVKAIEDETAGAAPPRIFTGETFATDDAIRSRYGNLFRFQLQDGSEIVAAVVSISGGVYRIHARQGITSLLTVEIKSFEELEP